MAKLIAIGRLADPKGKNNNMINFQVKDSGETALQGRHYFNILGQSFVKDVLRVFKVNRVTDLPEKMKIKLILET